MFKKEAIVLRDQVRSHEEVLVNASKEQIVENLLEQLEENYQKGIGFAIYKVCLDSEGNAKEYGIFTDGYTKEECEEAIKLSVKNNISLTSKNVEVLE